MGISCIAYFVSELSGALMAVKPHSLQIIAYSNWRKMLSFSAEFFNTCAKLSYELNFNCPNLRCG